MRTLILDNHDSFTFNLFHLIGEVNGEEPIVIANDACPWEEAAALRFDNILISPGPGTPRRPHDLGLSEAAIRRSQAPLLGVCLGHQALVQLAGGEIVHAPEAVHGRIERIGHCGSGLFEGLASPLEVVRYHSLVAAAPLPSGLRVTARSQDGLVMALEDTTAPRWGVQFHPESICSEGGRRLLENFRDLSRALLGRSSVGFRAAPEKNAAAAIPSKTSDKGCCLHYRELAEMPDAEAAFLSCFAKERESFWLDSARLVPGLSRWSFLGTGPPGPSSLQGLQAALRQSSPCLPNEAEDTGAPFPFRGGWVGWVAYEAKEQCGYLRPFSCPVPEVALLFAERFLVLDHLERRAWVAAVVPDGAPCPSEWFDETAAVLDALATAPPPPAATRRASTLEVIARHDAHDYLSRIDTAQREICDGESYEVCLTNRLEIHAEADALTVYRHLRRLNPAPHAAFLRIKGVTVVGSSPERFLSMTAEGLLQAKPIKGTARRGDNPEEDRALADALRGGEKDRAENLMIVDLLRHDLGRVAELGSVSVPALMAVESYATLHQLVSTVQAQLAAGKDVVDALQAAFPPGSMTGAPKRRTLEIIDRLEEGPRGIYSGALGWIGLDGAADLSVVIRTLVEEAPGYWSLGAGGAITALSDPEAELEEMYLKAKAPLCALALAATGDAKNWRLSSAADQAAE